MTDSVVAHLHHALVQVLRSRGDGALDRPVTVAEIYQDLIPYRAARSIAGVELNADYEHALLRLLAGEGGRVRLEPATARDELRRELESPNPNVTLYRKYAACDVWVAAPADADRPGGSLSAGGAGPGAPAAVAARSGPTPRPQAAGGPVAERGATAAPFAERAAGAPAAGAQAAEPGGGSGGGACAFCGERLPPGRAARFCPFCGADQRRRPCARCGEALDVGWRYCIACGAPAAAGPGRGAAP
ncbi:MAG TPA: zinc ribbon domain-containing protein [Longimicrobiales bacterium]